MSINTIDLIGVYDMVYQKIFTYLPGLIRSEIIRMNTVEYFQGFKLKYYIKYANLAKD